MNVIEIRDISKKFRRRTSPKLLREHLQERLLRRSSRHDFYALRDVSFNIQQAEGVQIVGANGAGKSTLLSVISGLTKPDSGGVIVKGRVGALLELGSGFHPDLTGLENLVLNAALIGINENRMRALTPKIIEFSELGDVIEEPLRTYSSGMVVRLAFSVAISLDPDVLIIDEVLGVGDAAFQEKCFEAIRKLRQQGTALLCVSHGASPTSDLCSRAIWLHEGRLIRDGAYGDTIAEYRHFMQCPDRSRIPLLSSEKDLAASATSVGR